MMLLLLLLFARERLCGRSSLPLLNGVCVSAVHDADAALHVDERVGHGLVLRVERQRVFVRGLRLRQPPQTTQRRAHATEAPRPARPRPRAVLRLHQRSLEKDKRVQQHTSTTR